MMNKLIYILALGLLIVSCQNKKGENGGHEHHQPEKAPTEQSDNSKKSIPQEAHGNVGDTHITIKYHSPAVRERVIWGGLVPYGEVWVTGAHSATNIEFSKAIQVEETTIPKGKYAFFTIPGQDRWTLILNKNWEQHLADDYDQADDVIRIEVTPETGMPLTERLTYTIEDKGEGSGAIRMSWEKLSVSLPFKTD
ncbi:DUF2911 domain-containing protein [Echinicola vietnamensis]|nr:DUF2911 domain-containing protein [Echinicola vietnamensis]|tara:strand:+ start:7987 stop:8571 length:585 start_codon:yes stop_codon:yes gene_type:complete